MVALLGSVVVVIVVGVIAGADPYRQLGSGDPGWVVRLADPLVRILVDAAATIAVGSLVFAAFFTRARPDGLVAPTAYVALRTATRAAAVWSAGALLMIVLDAANQAGLPLHWVLSPAAMVTLAGVLESPRAWLFTALGGFVVAVGAGRTLRWGTTFILCGLSLATLLPPLVVGYSASDAGHDLSTGAILIHVPAAVVWLGTLIALLRARGLGALTPEVHQRYRRLSAVCALLVASSGVVDALLLVPDGAAWDTAYGGLVLAKLGVVIAFAVMLGWRRWRPRRLSARRFVAGEVLLLAAGFGLSVGLTHMAAPKFVGRAVTGGQTLLGYDLLVPPNLGRLAFDWRVDLVFAPLSAALAGWYLWSVRRLRRGGGSWPVARTVAWLAGCVVLLLATSSGLARYGAAMFSLEAVAHVLVGMLAPLCFALGAPLTLVKAAAPMAGALPGRREWVDLALASPLLRALTEPVVAGAAFALAPFGFFFSPLFELSVRYHWAHLAADSAFLVIGYLFAWVVVGADPVPYPASSLARLGVLLAVMPSCVLLGAAMIGVGHVLGDGAASANLYTAMALPWVSDLMGDQRWGGYLTLGSAEAVLLGVLVTVVVRWSRGADDDSYQELVAEVARRRRSAERAEPAQPQAVEYHQQRGGGHGGAGDERVEQAGGGHR